MKKLLFLISIFILFLTLPVFAEYKPIPKELRKQYKAEMEQIIEEEYPKIIKSIDELTKETKDLYKNVIKYGYYSNNQMNVINMTLIYEICIPASSIDLYSKLMQVTQEKYLGIKYEPFGTDSVNPFDEFIQPYFKDNNINTQKLSDIIKYQNKQNKIIKKYINMAEKYR